MIRELGRKVSGRWDFVILLSILDAVGIFVAYEMAGLRLQFWHTISYYAQYHPILEWAIIAAFILAGNGLAIWFYFHIKAGIPKLKRFFV
jgi:hypothetical protein